MKKIFSFVVCGLLATPSIDAAESMDSLLKGWDATATATLASDYVWRGVSQTENHPAIQGAIDVSHETGFYAGIWASNIEMFSETGKKNSLEIDLYTGVAGETDFGGALPVGLGWDIGLLRYEYFGNPNGNFTELYGGLSVSPVDWLSVSYYYYTGLSIEHRDPGDFQDASAEITLPWDVALGLHVGQYDQTGGADDYVDWKVGLSKVLAGFTFEVAWTGSDLSGSTADDHFVLSMSRTLGDPAPSETLPWGLDASANVTFATDYIYRGISQTHNDPTIQGSFDISHESGVYAGIWASNVDLDDSDGPITGNNLEMDLYVGIAGETSYGLGWDLGWLRYQYPHASKLNFNEIYTGLSYSPLEIVDLGFTYYYGVKIEHTHPGQYYDASTDIRILDWVSDASSVGAFVKDVNLGLHYGYYNLNRDVVAGASDPDYSDWKVGLSKDIGAFNFEVAYTDTDLNGSNLDDGRALFTVSTDL